MSVEEASAALEDAKAYGGPVIVHALTEKGHGYAPAIEDEADQFHAVGVIDPLTGMESVGVLGGATGQFTMGTAVALLAAASLWGWIGLLRRRRSAIGTLTFIAVLLAAPAFLRANGLLIILAVVMLLGAALVWLPPVRSRLRR